MERIRAIKEVCTCMASSLRVRRTLISPRHTPSLSNAVGRPMRQPPPSQFVGIQPGVSLCLYLPIFARLSISLLFFIRLQQLCMYVPTVGSYHACHQTGNLPIHPNLSICPSPDMSTMITSQSILFPESRHCDSHPLQCHAFARNDERTGFDEPPIRLIQPFDRIKFCDGGFSIRSAMASINRSYFAVSNLQHLFGSRFGHEMMYFSWWGISLAQESRVACHFGPTPHPAGRSEQKRRHTPDTTSWKGCLQ